MNLSEIETFLTIVSTKSITRTADLLFLSQPTVSHRLSSLEEELDFPLVIRQKGHKQVELTPKGRDFIPIAERLLSLWKETQALSLSGDQMPLTIGCTDSLNMALFAPLYQKIASSDNPIVLDIRTHQSSEIYNNLNSHDIDIGFVYHNLNYKNIITEKIFEEKLYLAQSENPAIKKHTVHTDELDASKSIFLSWDDNYQIWYDRWFPAGSRVKLKVDTITMLGKLWQDDSMWVIAPASAIIELSRTRRLFVSELRNAPPKRICYRITHREPKLSTQQTVKKFEEYLDAYLADLHFEIDPGNFIPR